MITLHQVIPWRRDAPCCHQHPLCQHSSPQEQPQLCVTLPGLVAPASSLEHPELVGWCQAHGGKQLRHGSHGEGRAQLCCHGGKEAAEPEPFHAGRNWSEMMAEDCRLPEVGRDKGLQGPEVEWLHLPLDGWSWGMKDSSSPHPYGC